MPYKYDPEIGEAVVPIKQAMEAAGQPEVHDVKQRRENFQGMIEAVKSAPIPTDVQITNFTTKTADGYELQLTWCQKKDAPKTPGRAAVYFPGGGMFLDFGDGGLGPIVAGHASKSNTPFLGVRYRLAPEHPYPTQVEDCYTGLTWLRDHSAELGVDPTRIAVYGASAGGCLAAAVALMARDRGFSPPLAKQILVYPMLDDRTVPDPDVEPFLIWSHDDNRTGWGALLGKGVAGTDKVPEYAAPARASSLEGLPPAYIDVGTLDLFLHEDIDYAQRLAKAKVGVELHVYPGVPHAFEAFAPNSKVMKLAEKLRADTLASV